MTAADLIIAFDPGRNIGCARVSPTGELLEQQVLSLSEVNRLELPHGAIILVGNGTGGGELMRSLRALGLEPLAVDERGTTMQARRLYWQHNPPRGLARLLPHGLRPQPEGLDGYAAWALALNWLQQRPV